MRYIFEEIDHPASVIPFYTEHYGWYRFWFNNFWLWVSIFGGGITGLLSIGYSLFVIFNNDPLPGLFLWTGPALAAIWFMCIFYQDRKAKINIDATIYRNAQIGKYLDLPREYRDELRPLAKIFWADMSDSKKCKEFGEIVEQYSQTITRQEIPSAFYNELDSVKIKLKGHTEIHSINKEFT